MLMNMSRPALRLAPPAAGPVSPLIEAMVNLMPDYSAGRRLHDLYVNRLQSALPGNYSQTFGTGPAFRGIFFPNWQADPLLAFADQGTGLGDDWWRGFSVAVLCQAIQELASDIRGQMLTDQIRAAVADRNNALRDRSASAYSMVLAATYEPLAALLRQVDRTTAKQEFHDCLLANVLTRQLWYQAGMWTSPAWEMFNQYAKYLALGATTTEVDTLIGQLMEAGLPVPDEVRPGRWLTYAEELLAKPNVDVDDIRTACAQAVTASTYIPTYGQGGPARMPNGNCYEFTANSQPGNQYRRAAGGSCFTGDTQVLDGSGQPVTLRQLRRGDTVLTRAGTGTVAYIGQPARGARAVYQVNGGGPVFTATHPFLNGADPDPGAAVPALLAIAPDALALSIPTLSQDGIAALGQGSQLLSRPPGRSGPAVPVTVTEVAEVPAGPDDGYLYDVHLEPGDGGRQEFWVGRGESFLLVAPEYPVIAQAGPAAVAIVALMEGLFASGGPLAPASPGWPAWVADAVHAFGPGVFQGALHEALAATPSFGAPPPQGSLEDRIDRLYSGLASADPETGAVVASLFDGLLGALGQWLSSIMALGWRTSTLLGGDVLVVTVFDLALTPDNPLPADSTVQLDVTVGGRAVSETTRMWDRRGRANTRFHHFFDQLLHVDLDSEDRAVDLAFAASVDGSRIPSVSAHAPGAVGDSALMFHSAVLLDASGAAVGEVRFDARRLARAAAAQELACSGLWTDQAAAAYANALGTSMVGPAISRLRALAPVTC